MSIKVGQIYKFKDETSINIVVITKEYLPTKDIGYCRYDLIFQDGEVHEWACVNDIKDLTFIAEYPTWQEAVNSKEFKNDTY